MKIFYSIHRHNPYNKYINHKKEDLVTKKQKTLLARLTRTLVATVAGLLATWLSGPAGLKLVSDPTAQSFMLAVVIPTLITVDKFFRYGSDDGES